MDYPDIAEIVANSIVDGECDKGILICGTGIGVSIAANKVKGIRAAHVTDVFSAKMAKEHNDAQIICLGAVSYTHLISVYHIICVPVGIFC